MGIFDNIAGLFTGDTAKDAANQQISGLQAGYAQASPLLQQAGGALQTNYTAGLQPFLQNFGTATGGTKALTDSLGLTGDPAQVQTRLAATPGYQFQLQQGNENVLRNASRTGSLNSGQTNIDLTNYGQGLANQTYQQFVNNLMPFLGATNSAARGIGDLYSGLGSGLAANLGQQANLGYGTQVGIGNANANATLAKNQGASNAIGLAENVIGLGASAAKFSDWNLKEDIAPVGELYDGQQIYRYRYIGDDTPHIGLMAQEVEQNYPEAVSEVAGFKAVDYGRATQFASQLADFL